MMPVCHGETVLAVGGQRLKMSRIGWGDARTAVYVRATVEWYLVSMPHDDSSPAENARKRNSNTRLSVHAGSLPVWHTIIEWDMDNHLASIWRPSGVHRTSMASMSTVGEQRAILHGNIPTSPSNGLGAA